MEINLKDILRTLRQEKNITQETLAKHLGITPQSVGKWERGEGYPDITLLPKIALYFDVTVDELLDVGKARIDETIERYQAESKKYWHLGENQKDLELWEKAYSEFPSDCRVMSGLMHAINRGAVYPCPKADAERIIFLGKEILKRSINTGERENAILKLCCTFESIGDKENALYYADMGGSFYTTRDDLRAHVLEGEEGVKATQSYIVDLIAAAAREAAYIMTKIKSTAVEKITTLKFAIDLLLLLFSDGNTGFYAHDLSLYYRYIADEYAELKDREKTLEALSESAEYAITACKTRTVKYTAPMVNRLLYDEEDTTKNYKGNVCDLLLDVLSRKYYDFLRDDNVFIKIKAEVERYAENGRT